MNQDLPVSFREQRDLLTRRQLFGRGASGLAMDEVGGGDRLETKGKGARRIDVQLADDTRAVPRSFQAGHHVRGILAIHPELPGGQADLSVLVRVQPG